jgi:hypothetical protein
VTDALVGKGPLSYWSPEKPVPCFECGAIGGSWRLEGVRRIWKRCPLCYGFNLRSAAADRWFAAQPFPFDTNSPEFKRWFALQPKALP